MNCKPKPQTQQTQVDKALHTLRTDPRYENMAKACGVKTANEKAKETGQSK